MRHTAEKLLKELRECKLYLISKVRNWFKKYLSFKNIFFTLTSTQTKFFSHFFTAVCVFTKRFRSFKRLRSSIAANKVFLHFYLNKKVIFLNQSPRFVSSRNGSEVSNDSEVPLPQTKFFLHFYLNKKVIFLNQSPRFVSSRNVSEVPLQQRKFFRFFLFK